MATILLSAAGAALGSGFGGSILGLSGAVIGRAVGATIGRSLDQRLIGAGSDAVEVGKIDRFRVTGVGYGTPIQEVWGRMRIAGEVVWASRFQERRQQSGGGKGAPKTATTTFSYSVSLAIALCRGEAQRVGRVWADGVEISGNSIDLRFYSGSEEQLPDPKIEAVEGEGFAPSYRGISYVVIENLELSRFGNRVPQFSFEVVRRANSKTSDGPRDLADAVKAVALIPGTGEYSLATTPVHFNFGPGQNISANVHTVQGETDFSTSLKQLSEELPNCESVSLIVSWFGNDLRCGHCQIQPKVEQQVREGVGMPWSVSGATRTDVAVVPTADGRSVYGGSPADRSVIEAIQAIRAAGKEVMFYPFILMDQLAENGLPDPWSDAPDQPVLPWRGRITLSKAPGLSGSTDQTLSAEDELNTFLGTASVADYSASVAGIDYSGPPEWSYRRFILHYAHLCALAGGVDAFCIGSEMRGLTQIRSSLNVFPATQAFKVLAAEVREILGASSKISYAADWSEYFGFQPGNDVFFNLDPLWADPNIDFVGIDNYMPISDWRDGPLNADRAWNSVYNIDYLGANIGRGEGYDWYYDSSEAELSQRRTPIADIAHNEDWVFRFKDLKGWWSNDHHERIGGVRQVVSTAWVPGMKPIRFTEYGCAALDKATNQPNRFLDAKSSESSLPRNSNGLRDDYLLLQYFLAMSCYWNSDNNNPVATLYSGQMVDFGKSHAWAWDARPFPEFPGNTQVWSDGENYSKGHWLNGRTSNQSLSSVTHELCWDASTGGNLRTDRLHGVLRGFSSNELTSTRSKLQTLSLIYGFDAMETNGAFVLANRSGSLATILDEDQLLQRKTSSGALEEKRDASAELIVGVRLTYVNSESDFEIRTADSIYPDGMDGGVIDTEFDISLTSFEANSVADRFLTETRLARDTVSFDLPISSFGFGAGDVFELRSREFRIDRIEESSYLKVDAVRVDLGAYEKTVERGDILSRSSTSSTTPVFCAFLDLPLLRGDELPHAPHVAVAASPWPGAVSVWSSASDNGYVMNTEISTPALIGETQTLLLSAPPGLWDNGSKLRVQMAYGQLGSEGQLDVLNGLNVIAVGDGSTGNWEVLQFTEAELIGSGTYELRGLLRGLAGSDATMPASWPIGSLLVMLDGFVPQVNLAIASRGLSRFYRVGASELGYADESVQARVEIFNGIGLRPWSVSHLACREDESGNVYASWIRRTRMDGDSWQSLEVPLSEELEKYSVTVMQGNTALRNDEVMSPFWIYSQVQKLSDGVTRPFEIVVSQISQSFGPGPSRSIIVS